jgi:predicted nucleic acid-binding protein
MRAVSNSGPLIHLSWIDQLGLLQQLFDDVVVPEGVRDELLRAEAGTLGLAVLRDAFTAGQLHVRAVEDVAAVEMLVGPLGRGEVEAIMLTRELRVDFLLLDDLQARKSAERQGLRCMGTIGILRAARNRGLVPAATPLLIELRHHGFRISDVLLEQIRREEAP